LTLHRQKYLSLKKTDNLNSTIVSNKETRPGLTKESIKHKPFEILKSSSACTGAETCFDVTTELRPVSDGGFSCATSCNDMNGSETGDCDVNGASVWFKVVTDEPIYFIDY
jgi:hypothetical protein